MLRRLLHRHSLRTAVPFYMAMLLLVVSVAVILAGGAFFYSLFRVEKEDELDARLRAVGLAAEPGVGQAAELTMAALVDEAWRVTDWEDWFRLVPQYDVDFGRVSELLVDLRARAGLESVVLISPQGRVIADDAGHMQPGVVAPHLGVDRFAWEPALEGKVGATPYYEIDGVPHKRVYIPVHLPTYGEDMSPRVGAVLRLEGGLGAAGQILRLRNQVLVLGAVISALMLTVALLFYRLIRAFARLTETAAHRDRLQAMGALTAGIAHEIRNPLGIIRALAEGLAGDLSPNDPDHEMVVDIVDEVERLNRLVNQYLAFARPDTTAPGESAEPGRVVEELAHLLERDGAEAAPLRIESPESLPAVAMSEPALRQVLLNVLLNAREASPPERPIAVRAAVLRGGTAVEITVRDQGPGIPSRDLRRVFEPFFTTKTQGSGLGLAICRSMIEDCHGRIEIDSREGQGAAVRIVLPAAPQ